MELHLCSNITFLPFLFDFVSVLDSDLVYKQVDGQIMANIVRLGSGHYQCQLCEHISNQKGNMINHLEARHFPGPGVTCHLCNKLSATRQSHRMHLARIHLIKANNGASFGGKKC